MTVSTELSYNELAWTGVETVFAPGIQVADATHMVVRFRDADDVVTALTLGVHLAGSRDPTTGIFTATPIAMPATAGTVLFTRRTPATQQVAFRNLGGYSPAVHEKLHDLAAMRDAELLSQVGGIDVAGAQAAAAAAEEASEAAQLARDQAVNAAAIVAPNASLRDVKPIILDMHFRLLRGMPWAVGDPGGIVSYTLQNAAVLGDTTATLTGGSNSPVANQLWSYLSTDGTYHTTVVKSFSAPTVTFTEGLEAPIASGAKAWNFYTNAGHPGTPGYNAIADFILQQKLVAWRNVFRGAPTARSGTVVTPYAVNDRLSPGSLNSLAWSVACDAADEGAEFYWTPAKLGTHRLRFRPNCNGGGAVAAKVSWPGGFTAIDTTITKDDPSSKEIDFHAPVAGVTYTISLTRASGTFRVSEMFIDRLEGSVLASLDGCKIALLGDSWMALNSTITPFLDGIYDRLRARLPNSTFIRAGVGGQTGVQVDSRVAADVIAFNPDVVIVIEGTNSYNIFIQEGLQSYYIYDIVKQLQVAGCIPVYLTPSVGDITLPATFNQSRLYVDNGFYWGAPSPDDEAACPLVPYTPLVSSTDGPLANATATGSQRKVGRMREGQFVATITDNTGGSSQLVVTTPSAPPVDVTGIAARLTSGGVTIFGNMVAGDNTIRFAKIDGSYPVVTGSVVTCFYRYPEA